MQHLACPAGTAIPGHDLAARARTLICTKTLQRAAAELGVPKTALLAVAAQVPLRLGTISIVTEALDRQASGGGA